MPYRHRKICDWLHSGPRALNDVEQVGSSRVKTKKAAVQTNAPLPSCLKFQTMKKSAAVIASPAEIDPN
jgi:hypothetical protein